MDEQIKKFLGDVHMRSDGRLAPEHRPEVVLVGGGPGSKGYLVVLEIDTAVERVLLSVESHQASSLWKRAALHYRLRRA